MHGKNKMNEIINKIKLLSENHPSAPAIGDSQGEVIDYETLNRRVNSYANYLLSQGIRPGDRIGILYPRSFASIYAMYAAWKIGAAFIFLEPKECLPQNSSGEITMSRIKETKLKCLFSSEEILNKLPKKLSDDLIVIDLSSQQLDLEAAAITEPEVDLTEKELEIYIAYTSGSTGNPKGIRAGRSSLEGFYHDLGVNKLELKPYVSRVLWNTPLDFDAAIGVVLFTHAAGAMLHIATDAETQDFHKLLHQCIEHQVNTMVLIPSIARLILPYVNKLEQIKDLSIMFTGEELTKNLLQKFYKYCKLILTGYGPAEGPMGLTATRLSIDDEILSVHDPIAGREIFLVNKENELAADGEEAEICYKTKGLLGYLNNESATEALQIKIKGVNGIYWRSGDHAKYFTDPSTGTRLVKFLGRTEQEPKVAGVKISLPAMRDALTVHPQLDDAVVSLIDNTTDGYPRVSVVCIPKEGEEISSNEIRDYLKRKVSRIICTQIRVQRDTCLNKVGKFNLKEVIKDSIVCSNSKSVYSILKTIWQDLLGVNEFSPDAGFYELGGDSLLYLILQNMINTNSALNVEFREDNIGEKFKSDDSFGNLVKLIQQNQNRERYYQCLKKSNKLPVFLLGYDFDAMQKNFSRLIPSLNTVYLITSSNGYVDDITEQARDFIISIRHISYAGPCVVLLNDIREELLEEISKQLADADIKVKLIRKFKKLSYEDELSNDTEEDEGSYQSLGRGKSTLLSFITYQEYSLQLGSTRREFSQEQSEHIPEQHEFTEISTVIEKIEEELMLAKLKELSSQQARAIEFGGYDKDLPLKMVSSLDGDEHVFYMLQSFKHNNRPSNITSIYGSIGSGKTTLINRMLYEKFNQGEVVLKIALKTNNRNGLEKYFLEQGFDESDIYKIRKLGLTIIVDDIDCRDLYSNLDMCDHYLNSYYWWEDTKFILTNRQGTDWPRICSGYRVEDLVWSELREYLKQKNKQEIADKIETLSLTELTTNLSLFNCLIQTLENKPNVDSREEIIRNTTILWLTQNNIDDIDELYKCIAAINKYIKKPYSSLYYWNIFDNETDINIFSKKTRNTLNKLPITLGKYGSISFISKLMLPIIRDLYYSRQRQHVSVNLANEYLCNSFVNLYNKNSNQDPIITLPAITGEDAYATLAKYLNTPVISLKHPAYDNADANFSSIEQLAEYFARVILDNYSNKSISILGWSFGGTLVKHVASKLVAKGKVINSAIIVDAPSSVLLKNLSDDKFKQMLKSRADWAIAYYNLESFLKDYDEMLEEITLALSVDTFSKSELSNRIFQILIKYIELNQPVLIELKGLEYYKNTVTALKLCKLHQFQLLTEEEVSLDTSVPAYLIKAGSSCNFYEVFPSDNLGHDHITSANIKVISEADHFTITQGGAANILAKNIHEILGNTNIRSYLNLNIILQQIIQQQKSIFKTDIYIPAQASKHTDYNSSQPLLDLTNKFFGNKHKKVLFILGVSGAGKTLFSKYLTNKLSEDYSVNSNNSVLPIWIPFNGNLKDSIKAYFTKYGIDETLLIEQFKNKKLVFIIDGLDEGYFNYKDIDLINVIPNKLNAKIIISMRSNKLEQTKNIGEIEYLYLSPFQKQEMREFISLTLSDKSIDKQEQVLRYILNNKFLNQMCANPLMLSIILEHYESINLSARNSHLREMVSVYKIDSGQDNKAKESLKDRAYNREQLFDSYLADRLQRAIEILESQEGFKFRIPLNELIEKIPDLMCQETFFGDIYDQLIYDSDNMIHEFALKALPISVFNNRFIWEHRSFAEFHIAKILIKEISGEVDFNYVLKINLARETGVLMFIKDKVSNYIWEHNESLKKCLYDLINLSCDPGYNIAGSNAVTLINIIHKKDLPFPRNMQGVNISGANLENALLDHVNLSGANCSNVDFTDASLEGVNFTNTILSGSSLENLKQKKSHHFRRLYLLKQDVFLVESSNTLFPQIYNMQTNELYDFNEYFHENASHSSGAAYLCCTISLEQSCLAICYHFDNYNYIRYFDLNSLEKIKTSKIPGAKIEQAVFDTTANFILIYQGYDPKSKKFPLVLYERKTSKMKKRLCLQNCIDGAISFNPSTQCYIFSASKGPYVNDLLSIKLDNEGATTGYALKSEQKHSNSSMMQNRIILWENLSHQPELIMVYEQQRNTVHRYLLESKSMHDETLIHAEDVAKMQQSNSGKLLATVTSNNTVYLWDLTCNSLLGKKCFANIVKSVNFCDDDQNLIVSFTKTFEVLPVNKLRQVEQNTRVVATAMLHHPFLPLIALINSKTKNLEFWDSKSGKSFQPFKVDFECSAIDFSPCGLYLAVAGGSNIYIFRFGLNSLEHKFDISQYLIQTYDNSMEFIKTQIKLIKFSTCGSYLYIATQNSPENLLKWSIKDGMRLPSEEAELINLEANSYIPIDKDEVLISFDTYDSDEISRFDTSCVNMTHPSIYHRKGDFKESIRLEQHINKTIYCNDQKIIIATSDQSIYLLDASNHEIRQTINSRNCISDILLLNEFNCIVTGSFDGSLTFWPLDPENYKYEEDTLTIIRAHSGAITSMVVDLQGSLVTNGSDGALNHWSISREGNKLYLERVYSSLPIFNIDKTLGLDHIDYATFSEVKLPRKVAARLGYKKHINYMPEEAPFILQQFKAKQGDANAQAWLGRYYGDKSDVQSKQYAKFWLESAAENGSPTAKIRLGTMHRVVNELDTAYNFYLDAHRIFLDTDNHKLAFILRHCMQQLGNDYFKWGVRLMELFDSTDTKLKTNHYLYALKSFIRANQLGSIDAPFNIIKIFSEMGRNFEAYAISREYISKLEQFISENHNVAGEYIHLVGYVHLNCACLILNSENKLDSFLNPNESHLMRAAMHFEISSSCGIDAARDMYKAMIDELDQNERIKILDFLANNGTEKPSGMKRYRI